MMNTGLTDLNKMLATLSPQLSPERVVFCTLPTAKLADLVALEPLCTFKEVEGWTVLVRRETAVQQGLPFEGLFRQITLRVHSSLEAVGLTAVVATALADHNISANMVAAYFHDHIFVPEHKAEQALSVLTALAEQAP